MPLVSILEMPVQRALPLEALEAELRGKKAFTVYEHEAAQTSYYTARNIFFAVLGQLPERMQQAAGLGHRTDLSQVEREGIADPPVQQKKCPN